MIKQREVFHLTENVKWIWKRGAYELKALDPILLLETLGPTGSPVSW